MKNNVQKKRILRYFLFPLLLISLFTVKNNKTIPVSAASVITTKSSESYINDYYSSVNASLTGSALASALESRLKAERKSSFSYSSLQSTAFPYTDVDPTRPNDGYIVSFYSGKAVKGYSGMNKEHTWPNSHGGNKIENDPHMVRPTITAENSSRGNEYYAAPGNPGWDPAELGDYSARGMSARIIFYGAVIGKASGLVLEDVGRGQASGTGNRMGKLGDLLKWNLEYPVNQKEIIRNETLDISLNYNRNPFIDRPEYACSIWGDTNANTRSICGSAATVAVTSVSVTPTSGSVEVNKTLALTSNVLPANATNKNVTWTSSNNSIATVSNGIVTGKAVGSVTISATSVSDTTKKASATITVTNNQVAVASVELNKNSATLKVGESETLSATVLPNNATNKNVTWESSTPSVATVSSGGLVEAKAVGTATISVTSLSDPTKKASATITVISNDVAVASIELNKNSVSLNVGESETLSATVLPNNATNQAVLWESSNQAVASVSENGLVNALSIGTTTITVTSLSNPTIKAEALITVGSGDGENIPVTGVSLNKESLTMNIGNSETLSAGVYPSNATNKALIWESSDEEVVSVSGEGKVEALAVGSATISVTSVSDNTKKASATITVTEEDVPVTGVTVNKKELIMDVGDSETLNAAVLPNYATNKALNWQSSSEEVATVSEAGLVSALAFGSAKITVLTLDGEFKEFVYVTVRSASESGETVYQKALSWSASFLSLTRAGCETSNGELLSAAWLESQSTYNALAVEVQEIIKETPTGYTEGDSISHAKARYRIILNQYKLNDFIENPIASNQELVNDSTPSYLVFIVFGLMLAFVITGVIIYKSKKVKIA